MIIVFIENSNPTSLLSLSDYLCFFFSLVDPPDTYVHELLRTSCMSRAWLMETDVYNHSFLEADMSKATCIHEAPKVTVGWPVRSARIIPVLFQ